MAALQVTNVLVSTKYSVHTANRVLVLMKKAVLNYEHGRRRYGRHARLNLTMSKWL